jgi:hypothetical protein
MTGHISNADWGTPSGWLVEVRYTHHARSVLALDLGEAQCPPSIPAFRPPPRSKNRSSSRNWNCFAGSIPPGLEAAKAVLRARQTSLYYHGKRISMYSRHAAPGATVLIVASTAAPGRAPERALVSHAPARYAIAGTLSPTATRGSEVAAAFRLTAQRALLREVVDRPAPAEPANITDRPIGGSRALIG